MTLEEYEKFFGGLRKVDDTIALNKVDYDEVPKIRKGTEQNGGVMGKNDKWVQEKELQRILALEYVKEYCKKNGLSIEKLKKQKFEFSYNECGFFQRSNIKAEGLFNDKATMPRLTLLIRNSDGNLIIEETEYTKKYLKEDIDSMKWDADEEISYE